MARHLYAYPIGDAEPPEEVVMRQLAARPAPAGPLEAHAARRRSHRLGQNGPLGAVPTAATMDADESVGTQLAVAGDQLADGPTHRLGILTTAPDGARGR